MPRSPFDEHASEYDSWFLRNRNLLASEVRLVRAAVGAPGRALSVGCGSGLFEMLLEREHGVAIREGVEPTPGMAEIARRRGMDVRIAGSEKIPHDDASFDTVLLNGVPAYLPGLGPTLSEAMRVLKPDGHVVVADVPASSGFGVLYRLAALVGSWSDPRLASVAPPHPYPVEFLGAANWRTTEEVADAIRSAGFEDLEFFQTLTTHPRFADADVEDPSPGYRRGSYVAIRAVRPASEGGDS
jgi:SAM-dependent methyltransferase